MGLEVRRKVVDFYSFCFGKCAAVTFIFGRRLLGGVGFFYFWTDGVILAGGVLRV